MKPIRIGIVGVGQIGKVHLENYADIEGAQLVAAADIDEAELRAVAGKFGIPNAYADFRELLARDDIDAVDVCLHNNLHAPATVAALEAGKHVYCEKPIAGSYADGKAMLDAAARCEKQLHIQLNTLFDMETKAARRLIDDGRLGQLYHARSTGFRRRGRPWVDGYGSANFVKQAVAAGGALFDMGVYHIAQLLYLIDTPPVSRISGKIYQETEMDEARRVSGGYDVEELGLGFVKFEGGMTLDIIESWACHMNAFEGSCIMGAAGGVRLNPFSFHATVCDMEMDATFNLETTRQRGLDLSDDPTTHDSSQHHWIAALQGRTELLPTAHVALQTMLIQEGIYFSDELGREVSVDEAIAKSQSKSVAL